MGPGPPARSGPPARPGPPAWVTPPARPGPPAWVTRRSARAAHRPHGSRADRTFSTRCRMPIGIGAHRPHGSRADRTGRAPPAWAAYRPYGSRADRTTARRPGTSITGAEGPSHAPTPRRSSHASYRLDNRRQRPHYVGMGSPPAIRPAAGCTNCCTDTGAVRVIRRWTSCRRPVPRWPVARFPGHRTTPLPERPTSLPIATHSLGIRPFTHCHPRPLLCVASRHHLRDLLHHTRTPYRSPSHSSITHPIHPPRGDYPRRA